MNQQPIKLTEYSHGAGCGCKISPKILDKILSTNLPEFTDPNLLVGNTTRDDAAVYQLDEKTGIISTTDFFMPIVDDPFTFGRIAATNAISDIYAMGGTPMMAIAILGWPVDVLAPEIAQQVVDGGRQACADAGIMLGGGHSIDTPEPIFGLAVTGQIPLELLKRNSTAKPGDRLYLTKPLGIGILTTAQKQKKLKEEDCHIAIDAMCLLNKIGIDIAHLKGVNALTDVTGFGLGGHLVEVCQSADLTASLDTSKLPLLPKVEEYLAQGCTPGGTQRNYESYGEFIGPISEHQKAFLCDPQTSGGLLICVSAEGESELIALLQANDIEPRHIGKLGLRTPNTPLVEIDPS